MLKWFTLAVVLGAAVCGEPEQVEGIYQLDASNFAEFVQLNPGTLVLFHETTCGYCDRIKEAFRKSLEKNQARYPELRAAVANGEEETLKGANDIDKLPQLRLYLNKGFFVFYEDDFSDEGLQSFLEHYLQTRSEPLFVDSDRAFVRYNNKQNAIMLSFPSVGEEEREFALGLQRAVPDLPVYYMKTTSKYAYMVFPEDSSKSNFKLKMKRNFDEGDKFLGTRDMFEPRHVLKIVWPYRKSRVEVFSERHLDQTLRARKPAVYFFDAEYDSDAAETFSKAFLSEGLDSLAVKSNLREDGADRLRTLFGVTEDDFPTLRIVRVKDGRVQKFRLEGPVTQSTVTDLLSGFKDDKLTEYKKTQKPFDNTGKTVLQLNRDTLSDLAADASTHLVVAFVGKNAAAMHELLEQTAPLLRNRSAFTLAVIDVNRNDIEGLNRTKVPFIQVLTKAQRKRPLTYEDAETPQALAAFLNDSVEGADEL